LGIVFSGPADPIIQVINGLRNKKVLLVIDNLEHLTAGITILGEILQQAPNVKMLLTSREQMHLQWEWIFDVQGLPSSRGGNRRSIRDEQRSHPVLAACAPDRRRTTP
jgi:hypothetical protein